MTSRTGFHASVPVEELTVVGVREREIDLRDSVTDAARQLRRQPRRTPTTLPLPDSSTVIRTRFLPGFLAQ